MFILDIIFKIFINNYKEIIKFSGFGVIYV